MKRISNLLLICSLILSVCAVRETMLMRYEIEQMKFVIIQIMASKKKATPPKTAPGKAPREWVI